MSSGDPLNSGVQVYEVAGRFLQATVEISDAITYIRSSAPENIFFILLSVSFVFARCTLGHGFPRQKHASFFSDYDFVKY